MINDEGNRIIEEIKAIKATLDLSHDVDRDYLPKQLRELRTYTFQVHASYEKSLEMLIWRDYLKSDADYDSLSLLFERLNFQDKLKLVRSVLPEFPHKITSQLNELRNVFAHKKGEMVRRNYRTDEELLTEYKFLEQAHNSLNGFWDRHLKLTQT